MKKDFNKYIEKEKLFSGKDKILAAVSGGIDSIVMLNLLFAGGYKMGVAHCNFCLRGKESDGDEKFVKELTRRYKVPFYSEKFDTEKTAKEKGISVQMAARELRYEWLERIRKKHGYNVIAVAHHSDDVMETFFINLIRGTGIAGLSGIKPKVEKIVRPMLFFSKDDVNDYAKRNKLKFREDGSNRSNKYLRNRIRHKLIPLLEEMNPEIKTNIGSLTGRLSSVENIFNEVVKKEKEKILHRHESCITIDVGGLLKLSDPEIYLYEFVKQYGFSGEIISKIISSMDDSEAKVFYSSTHRIIKDRRKLLVTELIQDINPDEYLISKEIKSLRSPLNIVFSKNEYTKGFVIPKDKTTALLDFNKLKFPLKLRKWCAGDYFYPYGMKGKKKLSDFFTDLKMSLIEKENTWLLCSGNDIVWIVGHRIDGRYCINEKTKIILTLRLKRLGNN